MPRIDDVNVGFAEIATICRLRTLDSVHRGLVSTDMT